MTNKPKVLILGASAESAAFMELLLQEGLSLVCLDKKPALPVALLQRHQSNLKCLALDFSQVDLVKELVLKEHISHTIALPVGRSLVVLGQINDEFNFAGPSYEITDTLTNKLKFHEFCATHGINHAPYISLAPESLPLSASTIEHIEQTLGYPLIAKPNMGSGSLGVRVIASRADLLSYRLPERFAHSTLLLEKLIVGTEFSVNVLVDNVGEAYLMGLFKKEISPEPYRQEVAYFSANFSSIIKELQPFFKDLINKLNIRSSFLHADTLISAQGPIVVDISPRLAGNKVLSLLCQAGNNPLALYHNVIVKGQKPCIKEQSNACVLRFLNFERPFVYRKPVLRSLDKIFNAQEQEHILRWRNELKYGYSYGPMVCGSDTLRGFIMAHHESLELADDLCRRFVAALV